jgi:DNA-binding beta-propeller fold protein YncE
MRQSILRRSVWCALAIALVAGGGHLASTVAAQSLVTGDGPYRLTGNTRLGYMASAHVYDPSLNRLYSSSTSGIFQTDLSSMKILSRTTDVRGAGSLSLDAARGELYVLALHDDAMRVIDVSTGKVVRSFEAPAWFNVFYEQTKGELYYLRGDTEEVRVADRISGKSITSIALAGQPSYLIGDPERHRILVRLANKPMIQVIDTADHTITASWPARQDGLAAMALDGTGTRLFASAGRDVVMLDAATGKELGRCSAGAETTSMVFDPATGYLVALSGGNYVNVIKTSADGIKLVQSLDTRANVHDLFLNPKTHAVMGVGRRVDEDVFAMTRPPSEPGGSATLLTLTLKQ